MPSTARGDLVEDDDLIAALRSGRVAYAGLDVYQGEPSIHEGYYGLENTFLLPHMGTSSLEARNEMGFAALDNVDAVLAGREPPHPVVQKKTPGTRPGVAKRRAEKALSQFQHLGRMRRARRQWVRPGETITLRASVL